MLGFAWFYSSESGLFNGLRAKKLKKHFPVSPPYAEDVSAAFPLLLSRLASPPSGGSEPIAVDAVGGPSKTGVLPDALWTAPAAFAEARLENSGEQEKDSVIFGFLASVCLPAAPAIDRKLRSARAFALEFTQRRARRRRSIPRKTQQALARQAITFQLDPGLGPTRALPPATWLRPFISQIAA